MQYENCFIHAPPIVEKFNNKNMNNKELKGSWDEQKSKLKKTFAILTDSDLLFIEGKKDEMLGKIQVKLGKTKEEFQKIIAEL